MAEQAQERSWKKLAIVCVIAIELIGGASGFLSNSGYDNHWFAALNKPSFTPPGWVFGVVWPTLYALIGIALAMILAQSPSGRRLVALGTFFAQLVLNFIWSPVFFRFHDIRLASIIIYLMILLAAYAAGQFKRIRTAAGLLMIPYLAWLIFAATANSTIDRMNPDAGTSLLG